MNTIRVLDGFSRTSDSDVFFRGMTVQSNMLDNPRFPSPPVDLAVLKTDLETLAALMAECDKGTKAIIAEKNKQRAEVILKLRLLARYVEVTSRNDLSIFLTSGFTVAGTRTPSTSLSERIRSMDHGDNSGDVILRLSAHPGAASYEVRYAPAGMDNLPVSAWIVQPVTNVRSRIAIKGLTPGVKYLFQVRAVVNNGYTDWTNPVAFIST